MQESDMKIILMLFLQMVGRIEILQVCMILVLLQRIGIITNCTQRKHAADHDLA